MTADPSKAERILAAAERVLAAEGFAGTTVAAVSAEAGVSRGLLHYYFDSKEEMLARMLRRSTEEAWTLIEEHVRAAGSADDLAARLERGMREYARTHERSVSLLAEGLALARNHPRIRDEMTALHREGQRIFTAALDEARAEGRLPLTMPAAGLATLLIALFDGLGLELQTIDGLSEEEETWTAFREGLRRLLS